MKRPTFSISNHKDNALTEKEFKKLTNKVVNTPLMPISSTYIRDNLQNNRSDVKRCLMPKVYEYIFKYGLYNTKSI